jgi:hypothetical protein
MRLKWHDHVSTIDYRNVTPSELQSSTAKRDCARAMFPLNAILLLSAALAVSIDECGLFFHEHQSMFARRIHQNVKAGGLSQ